MKNNNIRIIMGTLGFLIGLLLWKTIGLFFDENIPLINFWSILTGIMISLMFFVGLPYPKIEKQQPKARRKT